MGGEKTIKIEIAPKSIFFLLLILFSLWFLSQIKAVVFIFFFSFILTSALSPIVSVLVKKGFPRPLSVLLIYFFFLLFLALLLLSVVPPLVSQTRDFLVSLPLLLGKAVFDQYSRNLTSLLTQEITRVSGHALRITVNAATGIFSLFTTLVITFYLLLEKEKFYQSLVGLFPLPYQKRIREGILRVERKLGAWVRGQVFLGFVVGLASFVGLTILGVGFAAPLAIIAGVLECVPTLGPIISAVPAIIVGATDSVLKAFLVAGLYTLIQQLENNFLVPQVMKKAVGVDPLITILALLVGGKMLGILGAALAVPVVGVLMIISQEIMRAIYDAAD